MAGQDIAAAQEGALRATARQFLNGPGPSTMTSPSATTSRAAAAGGRGGFQIDPDVLAPDSDTPYRLATDRLLAVQIDRPLWQGERSALHLRATLGHGRSRYRLPQGMGALTDPTTIGFRSLILAPELVAERRWGLGPADLVLRLGVGQQISQTRTTVRSALLDVRNRDMAHLPYLVIGTGLALPEAGPRLDLEARISARDAVQLRSSLSLPLTRR